MTRRCRRCRSQELSDEGIEWVFYHTRNSSEMPKSVHGFSRRFWGQVINRNKMLRFRNDGRLPTFFVGIFRSILIRYTIDIHSHHSRVEATSEFTESSVTVSYLEIYNEDPTVAAGSHGQRGWTTARPWLFRMLAIQIYTVDDRGVLRFMDCSSQKAIIHHLDRFFFPFTDMA